MAFRCLVGCRSVMAISIRLCHWARRRFLMQMPARCWYPPPRVADTAAWSSLARIQNQQGQQAGHNAPERRAYGKQRQPGRAHHKGSQGRLALPGLGHGYGQTIGDRTEQRQCGNREHQFLGECAEQACQRRAENPGNSIENPAPDRGCVALFLVFVSLRAGADGLNAGRAVFADRDANHGHLRLNFSHIDPARLDEGIKRLASVVRTAQNLQAA
ncbi:s I and II aminotransferase [Pseudomonas syringae pv. tomato]|nr:s I and II aminotransferase [Pseudomonas syringae pv. tomato]